VGHIRPWLTLGLAILAVAVVLVGLGLSGRGLPLPKLLVSALEDRANRALDGRARLLIGHGDLVVSRGFIPQIRLAEVTLTNPAGRQLAKVDDLRTSLDPNDLLHGRLALERMAISGAHVAIQRGADGTLDVAPAAKSFSGAAQSPAQILDAIDKTFALPALSGVDRITITDLSVLLDDRRSHQVWTLSEGELILTQTPQALSTDIRFALRGQTSQSLSPAAGAGGGSAAGSTPGRGGLRQGHASLHLLTDKASSAASAELDFDGMQARDLALQVPAIAWLSVLDAPIAGQISTGLDATGAIGPLTASMSLGQGALQPTRTIRPIPFDRADLGLTYDPVSARISLTRLAVDSTALSASATGQAWLKDMASGLPKQMVGQITLSDLRADPAGLFASPVAVGRGVLDFRLDLSPFKLTIGQLALLDQGNRVGIKGQVAAGDQGWSVALDGRMDQIDITRLLALWPVSAAPNTRLWLGQNVQAGRFHDVNLAYRADPGQHPRIGLDFRFSDGDVRFMRTMPLIRGGAGYGTILGSTFTLVTEKGTVTAPRGGDLDVAGTVIQVPDIFKIPADLNVALRTHSPVTAALSIMDQPPFGYLTKANQPVDLATGWADVTARLSLPLVKGLKPGDVTYQADATLSQVSTSSLIRNRTLSADRLTLGVNHQGIRIEGQATLDGVPVKGRWSQLFGPDQVGISRVTATLDLSPASLATFAIGLPKGAVAGKGAGEITVDLHRGQAPAFVLTSDLAGLTLKIPEIGWTKAAGGKASLRVEGRFGAPATIDRLDLTGPGLSASGSVTLKPDNGLDHADFKGVKLGDWFTGDLALIGQGKGRAVGLTVRGGTADLRRAHFGASSQGSGKDAPVTIALDRLTVTDQIALTGFQGRFGTADGFRGSFAGQVNGRAPVQGSLAPAANGRLGFQISAGDAGAAFAAAGLYASGRGGTMVVQLVPRDAPGTYDGTLSVRDIRVVNAPALASLLDAISVVGLLQQLGGDGIAFHDVSGRFLLTPGAVEIQQGSAVGASMGISAMGLYRTADKTLALQGVISPVYLLNGIGRIFSRQREGIFGFNYTLKGPSTAPKVSVNPLSILTPGMFREIFRAAPPTIDDQPDQ